MHRARAKKYYAKKKMTKVEERPVEPTEPSEPSESASDSDVSECRVKRRRMDNDVIIPYSDIKKCVKKALKEQKEKKGNGAGYAASFFIHQHLYRVTQLTAQLIPAVRATPLTMYL